MIRGGENMEIVTGKKGYPHVTSRQDQALNRGIVGNDAIVLNVGMRLQPQIVNYNTMRIHNGVIVFKGVYCVIPYGDEEELIIDLADEGFHRKDIIYAHYTRTSDDIENVTIEVAVGTQTEGSPIEPSIPASDDPWEYAHEINVPLYSVDVNDRLIFNPIAKFKYADSLYDLSGELSDLCTTLGKNIHNYNEINEGWYSGFGITVTPYNDHLHLNGRLNNDLNSLIVECGVFYLDGDYKVITNLGVSSDLYVHINDGDRVIADTSNQNNLQFVSHGLVSVNLIINTHNQLDIDVYPMIYSADENTIYEIIGDLEDVTEEIEDLQENKADKADTYTKIEVDAKLSAIYTPAGDITCAGLNSTLLNAQHLNFVYNTTDSGTTTSDFTEGAGIPIPLGSNVAIVNAGTHEVPVYKFDLLSGFVDLTGYYTKTQTDGLLGDKVDKVVGKGLSTEDYTTAEKGKLADLENYDDTEIRGDIEEISGDIEGAKTVDGSVVTISDAAPINAQSVIVDIEPYQEGSGDPSPNNERPIHGWNECKIMGAGKNLSQYAGRGYYDMTGNFIDDYYNARSKPIFLKKGNTAISFLSSITPLSHTFVWFKDREMTQFLGRQETSTSRVRTYTATEDCYVITQINPGPNTSVMSEGKYLASEICLAYGSEEFDYEPYQGTDYTIDFGDTIYGAKYNATKGELVADKVGVDLGSLSWNRGATIIPNTYRYIANLSPSGKQADKNLHLNYAITSCYSLLNSDQTYNADTTGFCVTANSEVIIYDETHNTVTADDFKNYVTGQTLVYELATPYTIKLTPQQIKLLENTNTLYANCGDITLTYQPNNALGKALEVAEIGYDAQIEYIKNNYLPISEIAPVENRATASTSYAVDDYLCRGNKLYKVISPIAQGATFTDNNIQKTTVMAEILSRL